MGVLMRMYDIIKKKRDGAELSSKEIAFAVRGFTDGTIPDSQMSALAMAIFFRGMTDRECADLTGEMARSGDTLDLSAFGDITADKHSTGGVGDKTTLVLAPMCAALGMKVAKMSGRGLGHTGGTVDKLESIPGFRTDLSAAEFTAQVERIGIAVSGQSADLAPADKKLYKLRDECAEVESIPLIASSIMSKKLAAGSKNIVLDIKCGSGAFMKTVEDARLLGESMTKIGRSHGRRVCALITDMDVPLGYAVGNSMEVNEAVTVLRGGGPDDLRELCITICAVLHSMCTGEDEKASRIKAMNILENGEAYRVFLQWINAQGGDVSVFDGDGLLPVSSFVIPVRSAFDGYISGTDCEGIGYASLLLGAGRRAPGDPVDHSTGIMLVKKVGDKVCTGDVIAEVYAADEYDGKAAEVKLCESIRISNEPPEHSPLVLGRVDY